ncbi:MAG: HPr family phosphocarrier protein [Rhodovibrionaceae bacterium]
MPQDSTARAKRRVTIVNQKGLHARAAAKFVKLAASFDAEVTVSKSGQEVPGSSIMGLMMLAAAPGCQIELTASGREREAALDALAELVRRAFDEEQS